MVTIKSDRRKYDLYIVKRRTKQFFKKCKNKDDIVTEFINTVKAKHINELFYFLLSARNSLSQ